MAKVRTSPIWGAASATLTDIDWAILHELARDPLASSRAVADAVGISLSQAQGRIRALDRRSVSHVVAVLDTGASGQSLAWVTVDVRGRAVELVARELAAIREVMMVSALAGGAHDILMCVRFRQIGDLDERLLRKMAKIEGIIRHDLSIVIASPVFRSEYVTISPDFLKTDVEGIVGDLAIDFDDSVLDTLDRQIVAELQVNGRASAKYISNKYDISAGAVRYRIRNLQNSGVMRFMTLFLPQELGINNFAFVQISVMNGSVDQVISDLRSRLWLPQLFLCTGSRNIKAVMLAETLDQIMTERIQDIRNIRGVSQADISPISRAYKFEMRWGQPFTEPYDHARPTATK